VIEFLILWKWTILGGFCLGFAVQIWRRDPVIAGFLVACAVLFAVIGVV
jgi:FtsH-binding integral membrane protein